MSSKSTVLLSLLILIATWSHATNLNLVGPAPSPGQEKALNALNKAFESKGLQLVRHTETFDTGLTAAAIKGLSQPFYPEVGLVSLAGKELQYWYDLGTLNALNKVSPPGEWRELMPSQVLDSVTHRNQVIGIPISILTANWLWGNKLLIDNTGIPTDGTWPTFVAQLEALQAQDVIPMVLDGSHEHDLLLFEALYISMFGAENYQAIFSDLSSAALRKAKDQFLASFERLEEIKPFISRSSDPVSWFTSINRINAAEVGYSVQSMKAIGEFNAAGKIANQQYYCQEFPGEFKATTFRVDAIGVFKRDSNSDDQAITAATQVILDKDAQFIYNNYVGSHPVVANAGLEAINECMRVSLARIEASKADNTLMPSMALGMSLSVNITAEVSAVIEEFFEQDLSPADAAKMLQKRLKYASLLIS